MKNTIRTIALGSVSALALAAAGNASAASVDVYGWIHGTATYEDGGSSNLTFGGGSNNNSASRFGIRGNMDLAPGLTGVAQLEYGVIDTQGAAGDSRINLRLANAGLQFDDVGTLRLGSQWYMHYLWATSHTDILLGAYAGTSNAATLGGPFRSDNAVTFTTADLGGVQLFLAANADTDSGDDIDRINAALRYHGGPLTVAASVVDEQASGGETIIAVGVTVDTGPAVFSAVINDRDNADTTNWEAAVSLPVTPEWTLKGKVAGFDGADDGTGWGVEAAYSFGGGALAYVGAGDNDTSTGNTTVGTGFRVMF